jgi:hypothetical protein
MNAKLWQETIPAESCVHNNLCCSSTINSCWLVLLYTNMNHARLTKKSVTPKNRFTVTNHTYPITATPPPPPSGHLIYDGSVADPDLFTSDIRLWIPGFGSRGLRPDLSPGLQKLLVPYVIFFDAIFWFCITAKKSCKKFAKKLFTIGSWSRSEQKSSGYTKRLKANNRTLLWAAVHRKIVNSVRGGGGWWVGCIFDFCLIIFNQININKGSCCKTMGLPITGETIL